MTWVLCMNPATTRSLMPWMLMDVPRTLTRATFTSRLVSNSCKLSCLPALPASSHPMPPLLNHKMFILRLTRRRELDSHQRRNGAPLPPSDPLHKPRLLHDQFQTGTVASMSSNRSPRVPLLTASTSAMLAFQVLPDRALARSLVGRSLTPVLRAAPPRWVNPAHTRPLTLFPRSQMLPPRVTSELLVAAIRLVSHAVVSLLLPLDLLDLLALLVPMAVLLPLPTRAVLSALLLKFALFVMSALPLQDPDTLINSSTLAPLFLPKFQVVTQSPLVPQHLPLLLPPLMPLRAIVKIALPLP
jgi:hypothetical protein